MGNFCQTCGQRLPEASGRVCGLCHRRIRKGERFHFVGSVVQHRDCENPTLKQSDPPLQESLPREESDGNADG